MPFGRGLSVLSAFTSALQGSSSSLPFEDKHTPYRLCFPAFVTSCLTSVVFPLPMNPLITVTGIRVSGSSSSVESSASAPAGARADGDNRSSCKTPAAAADDDDEDFF